MAGKRDHEGYFMQDHRHAEPVPDEVVIRAGLPLGSGKGLFEIPTFTCPYCNRIVLINRKRTRPRAWDRKLDHYICDVCAAAIAQGKVLKTVKQQMDEIQAAAEKGQPIIIVP